MTAIALVSCASGQAGSGAKAGSTRSSTQVDANGDGKLEAGPPESLRVRHDLGQLAQPGETLATLAQISDLHVRDEESPARVPFLDRFGAPYTSAFRPQEALSPHVATATVRAVNRERPQAVVLTGDMIDSAQLNELETMLAVVEGGRVRPDSGRRGYEGVQTASNPDPLYYRPDNDAPRHPGMLDAAQEPFRSPGFTSPWLPVLGNHDILVQGEVQPDAGLQAAATGRRAVVSVDQKHLQPFQDPRAAADALLGRRIKGRDVRVTPDARRRHLRPPELLRRLGHEGRAGRLDYVRDIGRHARAVVLDTVRREGGSSGIVTAEQVTWLRRQLASAGDRWLFVFSHQPLLTSDGGAAALDALDSSPRVAAAISGHRHRNGIRARRTPEGGYWMIETASLSDFPQQARVLRLRTAAGGTAVLETWMIDHDGSGLAGVARELAFLDVQGGRPQQFAGRPRDRNALLPLPRTRTGSGPVR